MEIKKLIEQLKQGTQESKVLSLPLLIKGTKEKLEINNFEELFYCAFKTVNNRNFEITEDSKNFFDTLLQYFFQNEKFYNSPCLVKNENEPSLKKGLAIIGNSGVGKSGVLKTFEYIFRDLCEYNKYYSFKMISVSSVVSDFEFLADQYEKKEFYFKMSNGFRCFDDLKSEREASNFGKVNVLKDILFQRYENKSRTIITLNYDVDCPNDYMKALDEFGMRYDGRIYDRLFEMFNIIEVKGKSFRR